MAGADGATRTPGASTGPTPSNRPTSCSTFSSPRPSTPSSAAGRTMVAGRTASRVSVRRGRCRRGGSRPRRSAPRRSRRARRTGRTDGARIHTWIIGTGSNLTSPGPHSPSAFGEPRHPRVRRWREAQIPVDVPLGERAAELGHGLERRPGFGHVHRRHQRPLAADDLVHERLRAVGVEHPPVGLVVGVDEVLVAGAPVVDRGIAGGLGDGRIGVLREVREGVGDQVLRRGLLRRA